ncbi:unnamed protein product [Calicophoron daubneyi]|uniref:Uncharacterized protein n=1 Tax=Calicophoron daubneyi TaxID=300641 RepID=A0AAV2TY69_CALDB
MARPKPLGMKCTVFLLILSAWGVVMLSLMGVFARVDAVSFAEDIPLPSNLTDPGNHDVDEAYVMLSTNCFIAAGIYALILVFAVIQLYYNKRAHYAAH